MLGCDRFQHVAGISVEIFILDLGCIIQCPFRPFHEPVKVTLICQNSFLILWPSESASELFRIGDPLNVVMIESNPDLFAGEVKAAVHLFTGGSIDYLRDMIEPVVLRAGSGYDFVVGTLGLQKLCTVEVLSPCQYVNKLTDRGRGVRAVVVDLLTCIRVLGDPNVRTKGRLLFPATARFGGEYPLPEYNLGVAVNRRSSHLEAFADSFPLLLHTHPARLALAWVSLYEELRGFIRDSLDCLGEARSSIIPGLDADADEIATRWAKHILYLEDPLPERYAVWRPVVEAARGKLQSAQAPRA